MAKFSINIGAVIQALLSGISMTKLRQIVKSIQAFILEAEKEYPHSGTGTQKFDWVEAQCKRAFATIWEKNGAHFMDWLIQTVFSAMKLGGKV